MLSLQSVKARSFLMLGVVAYISAFLFSYVQWVAPRYEGWGMTYRDVPLGYILSSWAMCLIPALWIPRDLTRPSQILFFIQYFVIFIPASFILYYSGRPEFPPEEVLVIVVTLFFGLIILLSGYKIPLLRIKKYVVSGRTFWTVIWCLVVTCLVYLLYIFGRHFQIADFQNIYNVRNTADDIVAATGSSFAGYAQMWLSGFFLPFLFSVGVFRRRLGYILATAGGYLYLFGIGGAKSTALAIVYLSAFYFLVRGGGKYVGLKIALCFAGLLMIPPVFSLFGPVGEIVRDWYVAIIHARVFCIPQLSIGQYYDFFQTHPLTYGSHITGINLILDYPYERDIPRTIGEYFYDNPELTANVNMWAQDGIASFGLIGIPMVSVIAVIIFWIFDNIAQSHDMRFATVALGNIALIFANGSLFTTIVSGGLLLLTLALYFSPTMNVARADTYKIYG